MTITSQRFEKDSNLQCPLGRSLQLGFLTRCVLPTWHRSKKLNLPPNVCSTTSPSKQMRRIKCAMRKHDTPTQKVIKRVGYEGCVYVTYRQCRVSVIPSLGKVPTLLFLNAQRALFIIKDDHSHLDTFG